MKQEALLHFKDVHLTLIAFVLFMLTFIFLYFKVYKFTKKSHFDKMSQLPLDEEASYEHSR